jgi:hypothetical protein
VAINVTQNADGSLLLPGATAITVRQTNAGLQISSTDGLVIPTDTGAALAAKIAKAKASLASATADLATATADLAKVGGDLA